MTTIAFGATGVSRIAVWWRWTNLPPYTLVNLFDWGRDDAVQSCIVDDFGNLVDVHDFKRFDYADLQPI